MRRYSTVVLVLVLAQLALSNVVSLTKDDEENNVVLPVENVDSNVQTNAAVGANENTSCAQIGEFCVYHRDCCTRACLGYMKRCVSGRIVDEDDQSPQL